KYHIFLLYVILYLGTWDIMVEKDKEKIKLQNLVKSCLLEINELKIDLMNLENEKNLLKK
ncbi:hypothetical protein, partial [Methanobrevibacter arboriphilus]|uniref:hypothetical protein n=1 Tax=Methanobrevibacter arboriphilus TaxID=39441 RepID=UPI000A68A19E